ncbi:MAG: hypothetical protein A3C04_02685 [Candidatus Wildermuthbacteria bacterium RIFCSPHIGHO2_02_FULL_45_25]|uniref:Uncharacterized protein n=1 Tax=Candidatus Wildermuthbacteria bacterium RIFCSPHIGHO2_02_FULL_45_25 TaxID=1802450 RepID=A0A1G2QZC5_9BACT|nr:MAG: hypothetical protein A3C04_02685 [Candidatus Wildermuthbacteria bacterium RIFCSPHIGHO2_02_FULL_45_25]
MGEYKSVPGAALSPALVCFAQKSTSVAGTLLHLPGGKEFFFAAFVFVIWWYNKSSTQHLYKIC